MVHVRGAWAGASGMNIPSFRAGMLRLLRGGSFIVGCPVLLPILNRFYHHPYVPFRLELRSE